MPGGAARRGGWGGSAYDPACAGTGCAGVGFEEKTPQALESVEEMEEDLVAAAPAARSGGGVDGGGKGASSCSVLLGAAYLSTAYKR